jgi:hypothetical protein
MAELVLVMLASVGFAHILVDGKIAAPIRDWFRDKSNFITDVLSCHQCSAFYTGLLCGSIVYYPNWKYMLLSGPAGSLLSMGVAILFNYLEAQTIIRLPPESPDESPK